MSKQQSNFTTPEQSKRLLELGVPADSADCYYTAYGLISVIMPNINDTSFICEVGCTPCWSVGELMRIYAICFDPDFIEFDVFADGTTFLQQMIDKFEIWIDAMDFSKLEE